MTDPDALVRLYVVLRESSHLRALDPVEQRGLVHATRCDRCRSKLRHPTRTGSWRCGACGASWPSEERLTLRHSVDSTPRPGSAERALALYVDLGTTIDRFRRSRRWLWHARVYLAAALQPSWSIRQLTQEAADFWPHAPFAWRRDRVREMVVEGRAELARRFERGVGRRAA